MVSYDPHKQGSYAHKKVVFLSLMPCQQSYRFQTLGDFAVKYLLVFFLGKNSRGVARGGGGDLAVNPIQTRGADYAPHIAANPPTTTPGLKKSYLHL